MQNKTVANQDQANSLHEYFKCLIENFIANYEATLNSFNLLNFPSRMRLLSLMIQCLVRDNKLHSDIISAFLKDQNLRALLAEATPSRQNFNQPSDLYVIDNSGSGGTIQIISVIASIALSAVDICVLEKGKIDKSTIFANIPKSIDNFKAYCKGDPIHEEHLIALCGLTAQNGLNISFGDMHAITLNDFQSSYFFGNNPKVNLAIRSRFNRKMIFCGNKDDFESYIKNHQYSISTYPYDLNRNLRSVRLALILSLSTDKELVKPYVASDYLISSSGNMSSFIWSDGSTKLPQNHFAIQSNQVNKVSIKYLEIIDNDLSSINIAINRLLSAICVRDNLDDALVDAVMCWENIIGAEAEVTFRVCAAMAKLLSAQKNDSTTIFKELKGIYRSRSKLVHGDMNYSTDKTVVKQSILYAVRLLNAILDNSSLLALNSSERSKIILLQ